MFHVSAPTLIYKHWLNAALNYVLDKNEVNETDYINYLEQLSDAYLYDNFLAEKEQRIDYYHIIFTNKGKRSIFKHYSIDSILNNGTDVENFIIENYGEIPDSQNPPPPAAAGTPPAFLRPIDALKLLSSTVPANSSSKHFLL